LTNKWQQVTRGHKTCRFQCVFGRFVPPRAFSTADKDAAPQPGTFHTAKRWLQHKETLQ